MIETIRCPRRYCGSLLTERHDRQIGRLEMVCEPCDRNARGLCRDCPASKPYRALRCASCARRKMLARESAAARAEYAIPELRERKLATRRLRESTPEMRTKRAKETAARRAAKPKEPTTELDRIYKRAWSNHRYATDPVYREKIKRQTRERAQRRRLALLAEREANGAFVLVPRRYRKGERSGIAMHCHRVPTIAVESTITATHGDGRSATVSRTTYRHDPLIGGVNA
jgi:hypothetical protein